MMMRMIIMSDTKGAKQEQFRNEREGDFKREGVR